MMKARIPPHDLSAEVSVLGSILIDSDAIIQVAEIIKSDDFYEPSHQMIYAAMMELFEKRQPIDAVTLSNQLKKAKQLDTVGGSSTIAKLTNEVTTSSNVTHYANLVAEAAMRRNIISTAAELGELAFDESQEARDILDTTEQKIFQISQTQDRDAFVPIKDTLAESFERIDEMQRNPNSMRGIPTGLADLDGILAGFGKSNLLILAARPGMGKTALSLNIAQHIAVNEKKKVAIFSLEMSKEELVDRLLVSQADIDAWRLKTGRLDQQDFMKLSDAMGVLADTHIFIDDKPGMTIFEMRTKARRLSMEHGLDFLVVDYLQLAHGRTMDNRVQEVAEISQGLKNIARELKIPVLALSQLSRAIESRGEKTPQLSDLRESGSIEQDADAVMFLYRKDDDIRESVNLKIAKHRHGSVGDIDLYFRGDRMKFYGLETKR
ncbi:replicative DNA helicase [Patescibacteria group bacterium]|nr:replicative DNA helicase [Patescibacteria group bacterium]